MPAATSIDRFMTKSPHTIAHHATLAAARALMEKLNVRHLPVLDGGKLVGIVSDRDLSFVAGLAGVDPAQVKVSDAMSPDLFTVEKRAPLGEVAAEMADRKYGSAIVLESGKVIGVFTTVDGMRALAQLLSEKPPRK